MPKDGWKIKITRAVIKNWWKVILIILSIGIAFSGYDIKSKYFGCNKQPIKVKQGVQK